MKITKYFIIFLLITNVIFQSSCNFFKPKNDDNQVIIELNYLHIQDDNSFSIRFPAKPQHTTENLETDFGTVQNNIYTFQYSDDLVFIASFATYPDKINKFISSDDIVKSVAEGFTKELGLKYIEIENIKLNNKYSGFKYIASNENYWCYMTNYYVPNRLYQVGIFSEKSDIYKKTAQNFIESFKLL